MGRIKVSDYIMNFLAALGIRDVFYVSGGGAMHMNDSLGRNKDLRPVAMLHEQGAAIAAEAYARIHHGNNANVSAGMVGFGACLVTSGPGATNAVTGVAGAWQDGTPVVFLSGQVKRADLAGEQGVRQFGIQEIDIVSIVRSITKYAVQIREPGDIRYELEKAVCLALTRKPGPVWIDVPLDVQASLVEEETLRGFEPEREGISARLCCPDELADQVIKLFNGAKRPVLYLGHGVRMAGAVERARELYEYLGVPVLTSWNGVDLIEDSHPLFFGRPGAIGHRSANFIQQNADFVLTVGTRLNLLATGYNYEGFLGRAKHVMVEIDAAEMDKKSVHPALKIQCDAGEFLNKLWEKREEIDNTPREAWLSYCRRMQEKYPRFLPEQEPGEGYVNTYHLVDEISRQMKPWDIYQFTSSGTSADIAMQTFRIKWGQRAFLTKGLAAMGFDLPACIGSAVAARAGEYVAGAASSGAGECAAGAAGSGAGECADGAAGSGEEERAVGAAGGSAGKCVKAAQDRQVVCVTGDGSIMMNIQELEVLRRMELPVKIFVVDNGGYGMIYGSQSGNFKGRLTGCTEESGLTLPDIGRVAESFGLKTFQIEDEGCLAGQVEEVLQWEGPAVCIVHGDIAQKILPKQTNYMREDGQMASRPLEDMTPLLDREELKENIQVSTGGC